MDKREDIIDIARNYKILIQNNFPIQIEKAYLFGSYAKGTFREHSDIDIAFVVNHIDDDDYWSGIKLLWKLKRQIDYRIEPHVISRDTDYAGFLDEIQKTGIEINN
jgi:predicted nucleotidyltransferase